MTSHSKIIAALVGLFVFLCACLIVLSGLSGALFFFTRREPVAASTSLPSTIATPTGAQVDSALDTIEQQVKEIRGWQSTRTTPRNFLDRAQLREHQVDYFEKDYSVAEARDDVLSLAAFGLLDPSFDLYNLYLDLYSEDILGLYDPDVGELYILSERNRLGAVERSTFSHEYLHALQDQTHGFDALGWNDEAYEQDAQRFGALQAFMEGEAMLLESQWEKKHFTAADWEDYNSNAYVDPDSAFFRAPEWLQNDFYFPYLQGFQFVKSLYDHGGWTAVDAAYDQLPLSTEMILHPDKYNAYEQPVSVPEPPLGKALDSGWRIVDGNSQGEWYTYLVLARHLDAGEAEAAAAGWGGDSYTVAYNESTGQMIAAWQLVWDTPGDAEEFVDAFKDYGDQRFGVTATLAGGNLCWDALAEAACLYFTPQATLWILAPDLATLAQVRGAIDF